MFEIILAEAAQQSGQVRYSAYFEWQKRYRIYLVVFWYNL